MPQQALVVNQKDNEAAVLRSLESGAAVRLEIENAVLDIELTQSIQLGHKFALCNGFNEFAIHSIGPIV